MFENTLDKYPQFPKFLTEEYVFGREEDIAKGDITADAGNTFTAQDSYPLYGRFTTSANDNERAIWIEKQARTKLVKGAVLDFDFLFKMADVTQTEFIAGLITPGDTTPFIDTGFVADNLTLEKIDGEATLKLLYGINNANRAAYASQTIMTLVVDTWTQVRVRVVMDSVTDGTGIITVDYRSDSNIEELYLQSWVTAVDKLSVTTLPYDQVLARCVGFGNGEAASNTCDVMMGRFKAPTGIMPLV